MSSKLTDYLTKQLFIEKNVVTYRSLSRTFSIHVNQAKNELASFLTSARPAPEQPYATYLISGESSAPRTSEAAVFNGSKAAEGDEMEVDSQEESKETEEEAYEAGSEDVPQVTMVLVGQKDLNDAKSRFTRIYAEHIYCLSPSPLRDAGLICTPCPQIHEADTKLSVDASTLLGRVVGSHVHIGKVVPASIATSSKPKLELPSKPGLKREASVSKSKEQSAEPVKKEVKEDAPKPAKGPGKLDWSKAKPKGAVAKGTKAKGSDEPKKVKEEAMDTDVSEDTKKPVVKKEGSKSLSEKESKAPLKAESSTSAKLEPTKQRGTKRKSALQLDSDSDSETKPPPEPVAKSKGVKRKSPADSLSDDEEISRHSTPAVQAKPKAKKAIVSSDEEDDAPRTTTKGKGKQAAGKSSAKDLASTRSVKAMFDIDDDQVIQGSSRSGAKKVVAVKEEEEEEESDVPPPESQADTQDEDVDMAVEDDIPKVAPKKRKAKKVIPVGRNGLKKKRIVKEKMFMDKDGYMVTEDYSSYESVDEEEPEVPKAKKGAKAKKETQSTESKPAKASLKEPRKVKKPQEPSKKADLGGSKLKSQGSIQTFFSKK